MTAFVIAFPFFCFSERINADFVISVGSETNTRLSEFFADSRDCILDCFPARFICGIVEEGNLLVELIRGDERGCGYGQRADRARVPVGGADQLHCDF